MSKYRNIKVHVPTAEISEKVQEKLFEDGCHWKNLGSDILSCFEDVYLYIKCDGAIEYGFSGDVFADDPRPAVPYQSVLDPNYDVKIAWANGDVVQRLTETNHGGKWIDWHDSNSLDIDCGYDWRIKPKTKTIKQWEYKKTVFEGEEALVVRGV